jgi:phosphoglycolate phosphatase-like HAD superfamily hydrolase
MDLYLKLEVFSDVPDTLAQLKARGFTTAIL